MKKVDFGSANYYVNQSPATVKISGSLIEKTETRDIVPRPVLVITGRGKTAGRTPNLLRIRPDVVASAKELIDGPLYLIVELALKHYVTHLRARPADSVEMIAAESMG